MDTCTSTPALGTQKTQKSGRPQRRNEPAPAAVALRRSFPPLLPRLRLRHSACDEQGVQMTELETLSVKDLRKRAADLGVSEDAIEGARDGDQPKEDLIALIVAKQSGGGAAAALEAELAPLTLKELRARAAAEGVSEDAIDDARHATATSPRTTSSP